MNIKKAVIPAAGSGSRMRPLTDYLPKGMLPLGKKPVLHHLVEELRESSIEEIAIVCQSNQTAIFSYFREFDGINFIIDDSESGPGGAILEARDFVNNKNFVTIFVDAPVIGATRRHYLKKLIDISTNTEASALLAVYRVPEPEVSSRGIVTFKDDSVFNNSAPKKITDIIEKPSEDEVESIWASACRYVLSPDIFEALEKIDRDQKDELQLTTAIRYLIRENKTVLGLPLLEGITRYDTGHFEGYFEAFKVYAEKAMGDDG